LRGSESERVVGLYLFRNVRVRSRTERLMRYSNDESGGTIKTVQYQKVVNRHRKEVDAN
jgi:hypothetical protein